VANVNIQEALRKENAALREEITSAHTVLDKSGRGEPALHLSERVERLIKAHAAAERTIAALQAQIKELRSDVH
jgi:predicted GTPase